MTKYVRFKGGVIITDPETGRRVVPDMQPIDESTPIVKANRWAFESDDEVAERLAEQPVEQATKRPGQKRSAKRS